MNIVELLMWKIEEIHVTIYYGPLIASIKLRVASPTFEDGWLYTSICINVITIYIYVGKNIWYICIYEVVYFKEN